MLAYILDFLHRIVLCNVFRLGCRLFYGKGKRVQATQKSNPIVRCSAVFLAGRIRRKELSSVEVVSAFIERIRQINPLLNCVVDDRFKDAIQDAEAADKLVHSGKYTEEQLEKQFPFLGVPISTKDHLAVKGMIYTCGVWARKDIRADEDAVSVALMRTAGAIPFVLTNVPELCMAIETNNQLHGRTKNPFDTNRVCGGSSGGEGSLVSACGSPLGIGTDIGGSIRVPSAYNGIFGHKPSMLIVSRQGTFPSTKGRLDEMVGIGPMSKYTEDLMPALRVMAGSAAHLLRLDEPVDLAQLKVYYQFTDGGSLFTSGVEADIRAAIERAVNHFKKVSTQPPKRTQIKYFTQNFAIMFHYMGAMDLPALMTNGKGFNPFVELFKCIFGLSRHTLHSIALALKTKFYSPSPAEVAKFVASEASIREEFETMLGTDGVFLYPVQPTVAMFHTEHVVSLGNIAYTSIVNVLGLPSTAVPMGLGREGLPVGLQVIGGRNQDRLCLAVAKELEQVFGGWVEPGTSFKNF